MKPGDVDFSLLRKDFPMLEKTMHGKPLVYFDTAATAQKPRSVIEAESNFYSNHYGTVHRAIYQLAQYASDEYQKARIQIQKFIGAKHSEEIIFTRGTTESINLVAFCFGKAFVKPGDEVIISEIEHHSNIVPWQMMAEDRGAQLKVIPVKNSGELDLEAFKQLLSSKTKIVAITHIANSIGTLNPISLITKMAHAVNAKVLVDGAQAAPHLPINVQELGSDFYVFSGHKIYGPTGIGVLYGKRELFEEMPPYQGGGDMIETVSFDKTTYNQLPLKFEAGTPMIAQVMALSSAIDYITQIGLKNIGSHENILLEYATLKLSEIPNLKIYGSTANKGAILSFSIKDVHAYDLGSLLDLAGIAVRTGHHCAQPAMKRFDVSSMVRLSFGLYNTLQEIDYFVSSLKGILKKVF